MKKSKFSQSQIIMALKENESGRSVEEIRKNWESTRVPSIVGARSTEGWKLVR